MAELLLAEKLLALAYAPNTGRPQVGGAPLQCGLAGAIIAEAALSEVIQLDGNHIVAAHARLTGDPLLHAMVARIEQSGKRRKLQWWVQKLQSSALREHVAQRAVYDGLLHKEEVKVLLIFPVAHYWHTRPSEHADSVAQLRAVMGYTGSPDPQTVALLALVGATGLDGKLFGDIKGRERRRLIKEAVANDRIGRAVQKVIQSVQAGAAGAVAATGGGGGDGGGGAGGGGGGGGGG